MTDTFFDELKSELQKGVHKKGHPFRYGVLGTVGLSKMARLRIVVLREVHDNLTLTFFTDKRSKKLIHIKENNKVSMLFYHPKKLLQLKVEGLASVVIDESALSIYLNDVQPNSKKEYTSQNAPGSLVTKPESVEYLNSENHFCVVEIEPFKIEYLKLKSPNHHRIRFSKTDGNWNGEFLVP